MKFSAAEKQVLLGPLVVRCLVGGFVAYVSYAYNSEFKLNGIPASAMQCFAEAIAGFVLSVVGTVGVLGALPVLFHTWRAKEPRNA
jgi:hypothetical protein